MELKQKNEYEEAKNEYKDLLSKRDWPNNKTELDSYLQRINAQVEKVWQASALEAKSAVEVRADIRKIKEQVRDKELNTAEVNQVS
jgi:uncharacterized protein (DUF2236 family)